jgi:hypothetical protein
VNALENMFQQRREILKINGTVSGDEKLGQRELPFS